MQLFEVNLMLSCVSNDMWNSALHRAAAAGGGRNRFDALNLMEKQNLQTSKVVPDHPTGAVIALLTRDDGVLVDAFDHAGFTALHVAASASDAGAVAALCASGARFDTDLQLSMYLEEGTADAAV